MLAGTDQGGAATVNITVSLGRQAPASSPSDRRGTQANGIDRLHRHGHERPLMSVTDEHTPTPQEDEIYQALNAGDHDTIAELQDAAYSADQTPPASKPGDDSGDVQPTPAEQYEIDYANAHAHYQADHEAPEDEREQATAEQVADENEAAASL